MATYSVPFRGTTLYVTHEPTNWDVRDWRAALPGVGSTASYVWGAIAGAIAMWDNIAKPTEHRYFGPTPEPITLDRLLELAKPWEREFITQAFAETLEVAP